MTNPDSPAKELALSHESGINGMSEFPRSQVGSRGQGLRVLMLSPQPFFRARGTPFSVLHRVRGLLAAGHSVDLLAYPFGNDVPLPGLRVIRCRRPRFINDVGVGPSLAKIALDISLYSEVRRLLSGGDYDVVHSHEEAAFFGIRLARRHGLAHVYDMHSSLPQQLSNFRAYDWGPFQSMFRRLEHYALTNSDAIITVCPELASKVQETSPDASHALIENTADDTKVFGADQKDIRQRWSLEGKKIILYTGTLEAYQGIDMLVTAIGGVKEKIPNAHLLIVGGRSGQIERYRKQVVDLGIETSVTLVGAKSPSDMPSYAAAADVIVSPRCRGTNTPAKIYGYLRTGRPLVATDCLTHTQVLDPSIAHLVPPSPRGLVEGLTKVLSEPGYAGALATSARRRADEQYSDAAYLTKVGEFYERVRVYVEEHRRQNDAVSN